ncbi:hypothetical protein [Spirosoma rhododendri]|uniref:Uncharacterized protein n=1 Tax=Spirosoma rhododendri TaxID=2728024 RepID=A0A7L5DNJ2_9BACT|nr:hypothetical protein [Spirosoma rhododendri]QJD80054.1 hypothetical protein HH216_17765 [Spirosoma rhododendri]
MKATNFWLLGIALVALSNWSCAQDKPSWANDPTYSTSNYKHPNKAQAARQASTKQAVSVTAPATGDGQLANYKRQRPNQAPVGGVTVDHIPSASLANRNYKIQIPVREEAAPASAISRRAGTKKDTTSGSGNE